MSKNSAKSLQLIRDLREEVEDLREGLKAIDDLCTGEIEARFGGHNTLSIEQCGRKSKVYSLLVLPRNLARSALTFRDGGKEI